MSLVPETWHRVGMWREGSLISACGGGLIGICMRRVGGGGLGMVCVERGKLKT